MLFRSFFSFFFSLVFEIVELFLEDRNGTGASRKGEHPDEGGQSVLSERRPVSVNGALDSVVEVPSGDEWNECGDPEEDGGSLSYHRHYLGIEGGKRPCGEDGEEDLDPRGIEKQVERPRQHSSKCRRYQVAAFE